MNKKVLSILFISSVILVGCSSQSPTYSEQLEAPTPKELIPEANRLIEEGKINAALEKILPYAQRGTSDGRAEGVAGYIYSNELKDVAEAMKWYKKSAKKGNAISLYNLGNIYYDMQDYDQAYDCYEKSAKLNDPQAMYMELKDETVSSDIEDSFLQYDASKNVYKDPYNNIEYHKFKILELQQSTTDLKKLKIEPQTIFHYQCEQPSERRIYGEAN